MSAPLVFQNVSAGYHGEAMLAGISVNFPAGTVSGLVGPNGAGKTTLLRTALGFLKVSAGEVVVCDRSVATWSRQTLARTIAYLPQGADAHWPVSAARLVALGRLPHNGTSGAEEDDLAVREALARCDADAFAARRINELSSGERARVLLARALATRAPILLADEPAAHLDPAHQLKLMELLRDEAARGAAVVVTLHDLALASRFCDKLVVLKKGGIVGDGAPRTVLTPAVLDDVFGVEAWRPEAAGEAPVVPWKRT